MGGLHYKNYNVLSVALNRAKWMAEDGIHRHLHNLVRSLSYNYIIFMILALGVDLIKLFGVDFTLV